MKWESRFVALAVAVAVLGAGCIRDSSPTGPASSAGGVQGVQRAKTIGSQSFVGVIDNPYQPLIPGTLFVYQGVSDSLPELEHFHVTRQTKVILGVTCTVVADTSFVAGQLAEATFDWFAQDDQGNVWYFGEDSKSFVNGQVVSTEGSWEAGVNGAEPGIVMEAHPKAGDSYRQELAKNVAEDRAKVLSLTVSVTVPYGSFTNCLLTKEWSRLDQGVVENKYYAPNVGEVKSVDVKGSNDYSELVSVIHE